jgi:hypothetical protein
MQRTLFTLPLFAVLVPGGVAWAGPPDGVSGRMAFDRIGISAGLDRYGKEKDWRKRVAWLNWLAPTRDRGVRQVLLYEVESGDRVEVAAVAFGLLHKFYGTLPLPLAPGSVVAPLPLPGDAPPPPCCTSFTEPSPCR